MNIFVLTTNGYHQARVADQLGLLIDLLPSFGRDPETRSRYRFKWLYAAIHVVPVGSATVGWRADVIVNLAQPEDRLTQLAVDRYRQAVDAWCMKLTPRGLYLDLAS